MPGTIPAQFGPKQIRYDRLPSGGHTLVSILSTPPRRSPSTRWKYRSPLNTPGPPCLQAHGPEQTFAVGKATSRDQRRRLVENGRDSGERLGDGGVGCELKSWAPGKASCDAAIGRERNRSLRPAYDGPKHPDIARHPDLALSLIIAWSDLPQLPRDAVTPRQRENSVSRDAVAGQLSHGCISAIALPRSACHCGQ